MILGDFEHLAEGDKALCTGRILEVPVGRRCWDAWSILLVSPLMARGRSMPRETSPVEVIAPGVIERQSVSQPVQTGLKAIDAMVPIGRGQRELIIGDRQTGKTAVAVDAIINQKGTGITGASMWRSVRRTRRSPTWCASWKNTARWIIPSWSPPAPPSRPRCCTPRHTPAARWASTSATAPGCPHRL